MPRVLDFKNTVHEYLHSTHVSMNIEIVRITAVIPLLHSGPTGIPALYDTYVRDPKESLLCVKISSYIQTTIHFLPLIRG